MFDGEHRPPRLDARSHPVGGNSRAVWGTARYFRSSAAASMPACAQMASFCPLEPLTPMPPDVVPVCRHDGEPTLEVDDARDEAAAVGPPPCGKALSAYCFVERGLSAELRALPMAMSCDSICESSIRK